MDTVAKGQLSALQGSLRGTLLRPSDAGYDAARAVWNAMIGMRSVQVDPERRRACVEGGATLHEFDQEAQAYCLATRSASPPPPASRDSRWAAASAG